MADAPPISVMHDPRRATLSSLAVAAVLVGLKLGVGIATSSLALISAGIEFSGDVIAALITFFAVRLGGRTADRGHPYGHRRAENLGALGESAILLAGGIVVAVGAISHLVEGEGPLRVRWYMFAVVAVAVGLDLGRAGGSLAAAPTSSSGPSGARCPAATWSCTSSRGRGASTCATACSRSRSPSRS